MLHSPISGAVQLGMCVSTMEEVAGGREEKESGTKHCLNKHCPAGVILTVSTPSLMLASHVQKLTADGHPNILINVNKL